MCKSPKASFHGISTSWGFGTFAIREQKSANLKARPNGILLEHVSPRTLRHRG